jgi:hypothetical protein
MCNIDDFNHFAQARFQVAEFQRSFPGLWVNMVYLIEIVFIKLKLL